MVWVGMRLSTAPTRMGDSLVVKRVAIDPYENLSHILHHFSKCLSLWMGNGEYVQF